LGAIPTRRRGAVATPPARLAPPRGTVDSVRKGRAGAEGCREPALQVVARARAPRGPRSGRVGPSGQLEDLATTHPEVHDLLRPTPERVLPFHGDTRHFVAVPARHHLFVLRPNFHAIPWDEFFPILCLGGLRVEQPDRDVPRQILDRAHVD